MRYLKGIAIVLMIFALSLVSGCSEAIDDGVTTWRLGHEETAGSVMDEYAMEFKRLIEKRSEGAIEVEIFRTGEIGNHVDHVEFIQDGLLNFAIMNPGSTATTVPENNVFYNHFLFPPEQDDIKTILDDSEAIEILNEVNKEHDMYIHGWFTEGFNIWTANDPIRSPEDFAGQRIRTMQSPIIVSSYREYSANPTPMPYMEVYSGLQLGQIDAQVNPIFAVQEMHFYEVQDYLILSNQDAFIASMVSNYPFFKNLSPEKQQLVEEVTEEVNDFIHEVQKDLNERRLDMIKEASDIEIIELTEEEREVFREASGPVREAYREEAGVEGAEILRKLEQEVEELMNNQ